MKKIIRKRKTVLLVVLLLMLFSLMGNMAVFADDTAGGKDSATAVSLNVTYSGSVSSSNDLNFYEFILSESTQIELESTAYVSRITYALYDEDGTTMWYVNDKQCDSDTEEITLNQTFDLEAGTYYLKIAQSYVDYSEGSFTFVLRASDCLGMPIALEDTEVILRNTETYYLHADISSEFLEETSDVEAALDALTWYSEDEEIVSVSGEYAYNSYTQEVLFPLDVESTGSAVIRAESEDGDEISVTVTVVLYFKAGTDTNQYTHTALT